MTQAGDREVFADVSVRCGLCEKIRVEEHVVSERRLILRVNLDHHVRQVTIFARHYYLWHKEGYCYCYILPVHQTSSFLSSGVLILSKLYKCHANSLMQQ